LVPIVGRITYGGAIEPVVQIEHVRIPVGAACLPDSYSPVELQAYEIVGDAMMPRYDGGDAIVVWSQQRLPLTRYYGQEVVARARDGRKWLRYLQRGRRTSTAILTTFNAQPIGNVRIDWVGEVYLTVRKAQRATGKGKASVALTRKKQFIR